MSAVKISEVIGPVGRYVIGIDVGITMLMAENKRTSFVWENFMKNKEAQSAMDKVGFRTP